jgi:hypothetical protein
MPRHVETLLAMADNAASTGSFQREIRVFAGSKNKKVQLTATVTYSCNQGASLRDKKEALEGLLDGLQHMIRSNFDRS